MTSAISSYGWNPLLSPSYQTWASISSGGSSLGSSGLPSQLLSNLNTSQVSSSLLSPNGTSSLSTGLYNTVAVKPSNYSSAANAYQVMANALGGSSMSTQEFLSQMQQYTDPLLPANTSGASALLSGWQNSLLESSAPNFYLNTFNPYSYVAPVSGNQVNLLA